MQSSTEASSVTGGQQAAMQPQTQPACMSARRNTVAKEQVTGSKAVAPVDDSGNVSQGTELSPVPVVPMGVVSDAPASDYLPTR